MRLRSVIPQCAPDFISMTLSVLICSANAFASTDPIYREFTQRVRAAEKFQIPMASGGYQSFEYRTILDAPKYQEPMTADLYLDETQQKFIRRFFDKVFLQDGSYILLNGERVPLTCIYIDGIDNRYSGKDSPLIPDFVLRVYLVANDFTCTGPINPQWPSGSNRRETWETYLYFEVRDPTIMLPTETKLRYRWNEFPAVVINGGGP